MGIACTYTRAQFLTATALGATAFATSLVLGGCAGTGGSPDQPTPSDSGAGTATVKATARVAGAAGSGSDGSTLGDEIAGKVVVRPGQTVTLHNEPGSSVYPWTGDLRLTLTDARMLEGQEALDYASDHGVEIPSSIGEPGAYHEDGRLVSLSIEATALEGFEPMDSLGGLLPSMFNLRSDEENYADLAVGEVRGCAATYADGTSAMSTDNGRPRIDLHVGKTAQIECQMWVMDDVSASSLVIRPSVNQTDICTMELGLA